MAKKSCLANIEKVKNSAAMSEREEHNKNEKEKKNLVDFYLKNTTSA